LYAATLADAAPSPRAGPARGWKPLGRTWWPGRRNFGYAAGRVRLRRPTVVDSREPAAPMATQEPGEQPESTVLDESMPNESVTPESVTPDESVLPEASLTVLVYSDDRDIRARVTSALGRRPARDVPRLAYLECATQPAVLAALDGGKVDLAILDGEAVPSGGLGLCRQLKDEIYQCPPVLVLTGRPQDDWLAAWSRADAAVPHPLDPLLLADAAAKLLRTRLPGASVR